MTYVAVVAHRDKQLAGNDLSALRRELEAHGVSEPLWFEVDKSAQVPKCIRRALKAGADLVFVWGGDGTVQRCAEGLAGSGATLAILPAGTANLLASSLAIPLDLSEAVAIGVGATRRRLDLGVMNGERFAVMAGAGIDGLIMAGVSSKAKERLGRLAYIRSAIGATKAPRRQVKIKVDGQVWFEGKASCVLFGNVGTVTGGLHVFPDARPDDGFLEIGVVTARSATEWLRVLSRVVGRHPDQSPLVDITRGRRATVTLDRPTRYEIDGGPRTKTDKLRVTIDPGALWVSVPSTTGPA